MEKLPQIEGVKTVRITCFQYAKEIPIKSTYTEFIKEFMKAFEIRQKLKSLTFNLHFLSLTNEGKSRSFQYTLDSEESYKEAFLGKDSISRQCNQITGLAIFPNSEEPRDLKPQSDPVQIYKKNPVEINDKINVKSNFDNINDKKKKNLLLCSDLNDDEKKELIEILKKDINDLHMKIDFEEKKYKNLLARKNENNNKQKIYKGLDDENEIVPNYINHKENKNHYTKPLVKIPEELTIKYDNQEHESVLLKSNFYKKQSNILRKSIQNIKNNEIIEYTFHIVKEDINEIWPKDMILLCIPDDNDIYFKHVKLFNNELVKNYKKNNKEYFDVTITILFKQNIQYIKKGKYHLKAQLISDSLEIITLDAGKLELEIVD